LIELNKNITRLSVYFYDVFNEFWSTRAKFRGQANEELTPADEFRNILLPCLKRIFVNSRLQEFELKHYSKRALIDEDPRIKWMKRFGALHTALEKGAEGYDESRGKSAGRCSRDTNKCYHPKLITFSVASKPEKGAHLGRVKM
jgi:hypothetical protein